MSDDVIYYNISINNTSPDTAGLTKGKFALPLTANVQANNNIPILKNPNDYIGAIVRFSVPCFATPTISFIVQTGQSDINLGIGSFTLEYDGIFSNQVFHIYRPQIEDAVLPKPPLITQDFSTYYYFLYSYIWLIDIYNTALATAFTDLQSKTSGSLTNAKVPFFYYDPNTQLISLYADATYFDSSLVKPIYIYFNSVISQYFNGFPFNEVNVGSSNGVDDYFLITGANGINQKTLNSILYNVVSQEFISLGYLSPLKNIIITTTMNVNSEIFYVQSPSVLQNNNYINVLTDFIPDLSGGQEAGVGSKIFIYNASSLYRVFNFIDNNPLYSIQLGISWVDALGNIFPLLLVKGTIATVKLMFIKKSVFQNFSNMGPQILPPGRTINVLTSTNQQQPNQAKTLLQLQQEKEKNEYIPYGQTKEFYKKIYK